MLFLEGQVLIPWNNEESTTCFALYAVTEFGNDKHTLEQRILPSKVRHFNCFILFACNDGIRAEIGLVGGIVCSLTESSSKGIQTFFPCCLEFIFYKMASIIVIGDIILIEANPGGDSWWMDFFWICFGGQQSGQEFVWTCMKWKQYSVKGDFKDVVGTENSITY